VGLTPVSRIPFNRPFVTGKELEYIGLAIAGGHLSGDGAFTKRCSTWLEGTIGCPRALLTHSCTGALEMTALLAGVGPGDEIIMPSFTFPSTANAFVLRGAVPVFVDIRPDTLNIDERKIGGALTPRTRAIVVVHYAGVACEMTAIRAVAERSKLLLIEDAAHGLLASYRGQALGNLGHLAAISFHESKNLIAGEGGALLLNDARFVDRAEILREKGTNRSQFFRGEVDKYTWLDVGSSYLPSEVTAAFLWAQFEQAARISEARVTIWNRYYEAFDDLERQGRLRRPVVPPECRHNGHLFYLLLPDLRARNEVLDRLRDRSIHATFHYLPLHASPAGRRHGRAHGALFETEAACDRLVRLPLWAGMTEADVDEVADAVRKVLG
jgi:dTDP-4-amino-4,6-dideoxygalactose transaminase